MPKRGERPLHYILYIDTIDAVVAWRDVEDSD